MAHVLFTSFVHSGVHKEATLNDQNVDDMVIDFLEIGRK
jgi:hypothetical protein